MKDLTQYRLKVSFHLNTLNQHPYKDFHVGIRTTPPPPPEEYGSHCLNSGSFKRL
jgi:hypothetical protein